MESSRYEARTQPLEWQKTSRGDSQVTTNTKLESAIRDALDALDLSTEDDAELADTPRRVSELFERWLRPAELPQLEALDESGRRGDVIVVRDIAYHAFCAHHLVPFFGHAHIAYMPNASIVGFGAVPRLVQAAARGPNLQERMGTQIANAIDEALNPTALLVVLDARQMCIELTNEGCQPSTRYVTARGTWREDTARHAVDIFGHRRARHD